MDASFTPETLCVLLDIQRSCLHALKWKPLLLSPLLGSSKNEMVALLEQMRPLKERSRCQLPLLLDLDTHYRVHRFMLGVGYSGYDVTAWLKDILVLFGIWHAYKHTLQVVYRAFLLVPALLEDRVPNY